MTKRAALLSIILVMVSLQSAWTQFAWAQETLTLPKLVLPGLKNYAPSNPSETKSPTDLRELTLAAKLSEDTDIIESGIVWRIFKPDANDDGKLPLIATANGGTTRFALTPGSYLVHAGFGRAGITKRISVGTDTQAEVLVLDAGGLKLNAVLSGGVRIPSDKLRFSIYAGEEPENGERPLILPDARPDDIIRLNAGTYHVVSNYGAVNATIRADLVVEAGKMTDASVEHKAAELTLKLVRTEGGEALADTAWSVLNPSGEVIKESVGAYASMVLAEGDYVVIAKNKEKLYQREFNVVAGRNQDVEVLVSQPAETQANNVAP
ncbi:MAG: hypothetical protein ACRCU5_04180 [Rhizobiaceae bacterium]